ncbi:MAG TPA: adenine phosphoribosyltransferase [Bacteroidia bacterium]|jgi:adenine phosphoribosyltransferase|nr:adenine phosphoribosyltransferase [Bacteroidia bacterium]
MELSDKIKSVIRDIPDFPKPGVLFKDITPIFLQPALCNEITEAFCQPYLQKKPDAIIGIESRGFLFGMLMAQKLSVPFVMVRKAGKLPYKTISQEYSLEYGSAVIEMHEDSLLKGWDVLIHDDLLATGGTACAAAELVKKCGANVTSFTFVVELGFLNGKQKLLTHTNNIQCLIQY